MEQKSIDSKPCILIFTTAFRPFIGGSEIAIEEITKRLPDINFDILTPRYTRKLSKTEDLDNVRIHRVGWGLLSDKILFPLFGFWKARQLFRAHEYQIVHAYQASQGGGAAWLFSLFYPRFRFILTLQEGKNLDSQDGLIKFFRKLIIKRADVITVISNYLKDYARRFNRQAKIIVIPNGVDIKKFAGEYSYGELSFLADKLGIKPGEKVVTSVSRLVPKNGIDILIKAFQILNSKFKIYDVRLLIIGDGQQKNELISLARRAGVLEKIIWAGSVSHVDLPKYLKISDVFARPSRSEGLGNAFLEAMAVGVPIIGTRVGGIPDFLKNKETGLFAEIDDPEDLAVKINSVLNNKDLVGKLTNSAKSMVAEKYNWATIAGQFRELYFGLGE